MWGLQRMNCQCLFCSLHQSMGKRLYWKVKACTRRIFMSVERLSISQAIPCIIHCRQCQFLPAALTCFVVYLADGEASLQSFSARHTICKRQISEASKENGYRENARYGAVQLRSANLTASFSSSLGQGRQTLWRMGDPPY